jgi:hypothetical protein
LAAARVAFVRHKNAERRFALREQIDDRVLLAVGCALRADYGR